MAQQPFPDFEDFEASSLALSLALSIVPIRSSQASYVTAPLPTGTDGLTLTPTGTDGLTLTPTGTDGLTLTPIGTDGHPLWPGVY